MAKRSTARSQQIIYYRKSLGHAWVEGIPTYSAAVVKRDVSFYAREYGSENVRVEIIEKRPKYQPRYQRRERDESDDYGY